MKKYDLIMIFAFLIPAVFAFFLYSYGVVAERIGYAIAIGIVFIFPINGIVRGSDETYRKTASTSEKIVLVLDIVVFPIIYLSLSDYYHHFEPSGRCFNAWVSLLMSFIIVSVLAKIINFFVKLFEK